MIDDLMALLDGFDLASLVPELDALMGNLELVVRISVLAGPGLLLFLGLVYLILPPKEANHYVGFRSFWAMGSVQSWLFTQRLAGALWSLIGLGFGIAMWMLSKEFVNMEPMEMIMTGGKYLLWQIGAVLVSCVVVHLVIFVMFNGRGIYRFGKGRKRQLGE